MNMNTKIQAMKIATAKQQTRNAKRLKLTHDIGIAQEIVDELRGEGFSDDIIQETLAELGYNWEVIEALDLTTLMHKEEGQPYNFAGQQANITDINPGMNDDGEQNQESDGGEGSEPTPADSNAETDSGSEQGSASDNGNETTT